MQLNDMNFHKKKINLIFFGGGVCVWGGGGCRGGGNLHEEQSYLKTYSFNSQYLPFPPSLGAVGLYERQQMVVEAAGVGMSVVSVSFVLPGVGSDWLVVPPMIELLASESSL